MQWYNCCVVGWASCYSEKSFVASQRGTCFSQHALHTENPGYPSLRGVYLAAIEMYERKCCEDFYKHGLEDKSKVTDCWRGAMRLTATRLWAIRLCCVTIPSYRVSMRHIRLTDSQSLLLKCSNSHSRSWNTLPSLTVRYSTTHSDHSKHGARQ